MATDSNSAIGPAPAGDFAVFYGLSPRFHHDPDPFSSNSVIAFFISATIFGPPPT